MIDKATVKRILDTANIVEVVSDYVNLTRRGANYMGLCPFHNERTPSFSVSPSRGICHCFSCGKGGSPVNFIMEKEGINFHDALLRLADKYGIKVEERELTDAERIEQSRREAMLQINDWAMRRFRENMNATEEGRNVGLQYFFQRGLTQAAIEKFRLGYALDKPTDLFTAAAKQGFDSEALFNVGLCGKSSQSGMPYDRFRGRVIYPLINSAGKVIAFGGRGIKGEQAKYINSPESEIYHKSSELYGIFQAKNAIVREKRCFLVEGYMDVIGMWQSGIENVVASSGTSLTDGQVALIHRFTDKITIIYDGDSAGIHASLRAIDICLAQKLDVTLLLLPDGDDPDSFARKNSPEQFREYLAEHEQNFIAYQAYVFSLGSSGASSKTEALSMMVKSIAQVSDLIKRTVFIQECSRLMNVAESIITTAVSREQQNVLQAQRKRRQIARIEAETPAVAETMHAEQVEREKLLSQEQIKTISKDILTKPSLLHAVEKQLLEYVIRFGMVSFCPAIDDSGKETYLNVVEFVRDEFALDNISFSDPFFKALFERILSMTGSFRVQERENIESLNRKFDLEHQAWLSSMSEKALSLSQIEAEEQKQNEQRAAALQKEIHDFACSWIGNELGSDPDDKVRKFVLDTIIPKYTLSKYHTRNVHVETDDERLKDLIPRAMLEWKDALLQQQRKDAELRLKHATETSDNAMMIEAIKDIQQVNELRREVAKNLGERILSPRHRH